MSEAPETPLEIFTEYFVKHYPGPDTIIHNPHLHAPKIFRAAEYALKAEIAAKVAAERKRCVKSAKGAYEIHSGDDAETSSLFGRIAVAIREGSGDVG